MKARWLISLTWLLVGLALPAFGQQTIFDTLPAASSSSSVPIVSYEDMSGQSFTTTATAHVVTEVVVNLRYSNTPDGNYMVAIYGVDSSNGNRPTATAVAGGLIYNGNTSNLTVNSANVTFSGLNIVLLPTTTYYLVVAKNFNGGQLHWAQANNATTTASTGYSSEFLSYFDKTTSTWSAPTSTATQPLIMQVNAGTAVPELPSSVVLLVASGSCLVIQRWRAGLFRRGPSAS